VRDAPAAGRADDEGETAARHPLRGLLRVAAAVADGEARTSLSKRSCSSTSEVGTAAILSRRSPRLAYSAQATRGYFRVSDVLFAAAT
jgi:hypothetical protein